MTKFMQDVWHIHGAPLWVFLALTSGQMPGLLDHSPEGVLTVAYAIHPDLAVVEWSRLLSPEGPSPEAPVRTETARFRVDRETHRLTYTGTVSP